MWYPLKKEELEKLLDEYLSLELLKKHKTEGINGIIVPHAGYEYSGKICAKAYSLIKGAKKAVIFAPSHYISLTGAVTHEEKEWQTPLGSVKIISSTLRKINLNEEHAIDNQIPFLQKIGIKEILPVMVGNITIEQAEIIARQFEDFDGVFIFSTDLSHFQDYETATVRDKKTIKILENIDLENAEHIDACGFFPLLVFLHLAKIKKWKPKLLEYMNSGDINKDRSKVVGYAAIGF
jgi:hypothetical protein